MKHSRKIFDISKESNQSFIKKTKEIAIEIFIIVFAVTFSIWLHSIAEHKKEQKEVRTFLTNIRKDLKNDMDSLKVDVKDYKEDTKAYKSILQLTRSNIDSLDRVNSKIKFQIHLHSQKISNANYEGFKSSGKIENIENEDLRMAILSFYQQDVPAIIESSGLYKQYLLKTADVLIAQEDSNTQHVYLDTRFKSNTKFLIMVGDACIKLYEENPIKHASEIIKMIDKELVK
ncbi:MAG: DUF6090 family protein [Bacteroidota bacterium]|nr:DUF6090 family protein [Bacteroidota bacterium]